MQEFDILEIGDLSTPYIIIEMNGKSRLKIEVPPERLTRLKGADKVKLTVHPVYKRKKRGKS